MSVRLPWGIVRVHVVDVTAADIMCSGGALGLASEVWRVSGRAMPDKTATW